MTCFTSLYDRIVYFMPCSTQDRRWPHVRQTRFLRVLPEERTITCVWVYTLLSKHIKNDDSLRMVYIHAFIYINRIKIRRPVLEPVIIMMLKTFRFCHNDLQLSTQMAGVIKFHLNPFLHTFFVINRLHVQIMIQPGCHDQDTSILSFKYHQIVWWRRWVLRSSSQNTVWRTSPARQFENSPYQKLLRSFK